MLFQSGPPEANINGGYISWKIDKNNIYNN